AYTLSDSRAWQVFLHDLRVDEHLCRLTQCQEPLGTDSLTWVGVDGQDPSRAGCLHRRALEPRADLIYLCFRCLELCFCYRDIGGSDTREGLESSPFGLERPERDGCPRLLGLHGGRRQHMLMKKLLRPVGIGLDLSEARFLALDFGA